MNNFIDYISFEVIMYTTEDEIKVKKTLYFLQNNINLKLEEDIVEGYYGNIMKIIRCKILNKKNCYEFLTFFKKNLIEKDKKKIISEMKKRMDTHLNLYIKISKQKAFIG